MDPASACIAVAVDLALRRARGEGRIVEPAPTPGTFDLMVDGVGELADLLLR